MLALVMGTVVLLGTGRWGLLVTTCYVVLVYPFQGTTDVPGMWVDSWKALNCGLREAYEGLRLTVLTITR